MHSLLSHGMVTTLRTTSNCCLAGASARVPEDMNSADQVIWCPAPVLPASGSAGMCMRDSIIA